MWVSIKAPKHLQERADHREVGIHVAEVPAAPQGPSKPFHFLGQHLRSGSGVGFSFWGLGLGAVQSPRQRRFPQRPSVSSLRTRVTFQALVSDKSLSQFGEGVHLEDEMVGEEGGDLERSRAPQMAA